MREIEDFGCAHRAGRVIRIRGLFIELAHAPELSQLDFGWWRIHVKVASSGMASEV
jgi:hypothetical protein